MAEPGHRTLSSQIKKKIGVRIGFCFMIYTLILISIIFYDFQRGVNHIKQDLDDIAYNLDKYIISQVLIGNPESIETKLKSIRRKYDIKVNWYRNKNDQTETMRWFFPFRWEYVNNVRTLDNRNFGTLVFQGSFLRDKDFIFEISVKVLFLFLFLLFMIIMLYPLSEKIPKIIFIDPLMKILSLLKGKEVTMNPKGSKKKLKIQDIEDKINEIIDQTKRDMHHAAIGQVATQVAHDIRSPLATLNAMLDATQGLSEEQRQLIRNSVNRINQIAHNLLQNHKNQSVTNQTGFLRALPLYPLLKNIIAQKQIEYNQRIQIKLEVDDGAEMVFSNIDASIFSRVVSNLMNNAIEAIADTGTITVKLFWCKNNATIKVVDDGCGMPHSIIEKVFDYGFSYQKPSGTGLGLAWVKQQIEHWQGRINIHSTLGQGTTVTIELPQAEAPAWYANKIQVMADSILVVLDDDPMIHELWDYHLRSKGMLTEKNEIVHLYTMDQFKAWYRTRPSNKHVCYFIDYELRDHHSTGIDIIDDFELQSHSFLMTSRFEEEKIHRYCSRSGTKLLPKPSLPFVQFRIHPREPALIFIDDHKPLGMAWQYKAKQYNQTVVYFDNASEFIQLMDYFDKTVPIYIDSHLGKGEKGEAIAKTFDSHGFQKIYLTTGYDPASIPKPPWITAVVGKEPPFC